MSHVVLAPSGTKLPDFVTVRIFRNFFSLNTFSLNMISSSFLNTKLEIVLQVVLWDIMDEIVPINAYILIMAVFTSVIVRRNCDSVFGCKAISVASK